MEPIVVGVLALQGAFAKHIEMLRLLGVKPIEVRHPKDLKECDALIIPGGESTTMMKQMNFIDFEKEFKDFSEKKPVFGTCAGLILMSDEVIADDMKPFHLLDISVERNAFGRQSESFQSEIDLYLTSHGKPRHFPALFIRAPRIRRTGEHVQVLASFEGEPVFVKQGLHLGATFHPELTADQAIHTYFVQQVRNLKAKGKDKGT